MDAENKLISSWSQFNFKDRLLTHPGDCYLRQKSRNDELAIYKSFDDYFLSKHFGLSGDKSLHLGLLPIPYIGNLKQADIFILMQNPGLSSGDYFGEYLNKPFKAALKRSLLQTNSNDKYPFIFLNPEFSWHPGFQYWQKKFDWIIENLKQKNSCSYQDAMSHLSKRLVCLELLPYHSQSFGAGAMLKKLHSVDLMKKYAREFLLPKARSKKILMIVARSQKDWKLDTCSEVIVYKNTETRAAHFTGNSRGGKAIKKWCDQHRMD